MSATVEMSAYALREVMGEAFDSDLYERGRRDTRKLFHEHPELRQEKLDEVRSILRGAYFRNKPDPSYWVGCLCEMDFTW